MDEERVNHPKHYNAHPSGVECIDVVEHLPFNVGNAIKYLWRAGHKGSRVEDLQKARWYLMREIDRGEPLVSHKREHIMKLADDFANAEGNYRVASVVRSLVSACCGYADRDLVFLSSLTHLDRELEECR